jgi:anti-anti-sigma regulatory factor
LRLRKAITDRKAQLRLTAPGDPVWAVFLTTGLDKVFQFSHDTTTALAELQIGS